MTRKIQTVASFYQKYTHDESIKLKRVLTKVLSLSMYNNPIESGVKICEGH